MFANIGKVVAFLAMIGMLVVFGMAFNREQPAAAAPPATYEVTVAEPPPAPCPHCKPDCDCQAMAVTIRELEGEVEATTAAYAKLKASVKEAPTDNRYRVGDKRTNESGDWEVKWVKVKGKPKSVLVQPAPVEYASPCGPGGCQVPQQGRMRRGFIGW